MLSYLTTYFVAELLIKKFFRNLHPEFYSKLYRDRKDLQYFAFVMGIFITLFSAPTCYAAFQDSSHTNDLLGNPNLSTAGKVCMASRGVLWTSEFNRLDHSSKYINHHLTSLGYLVYHIQVGLPLRILYAFYASLITELLSDTTCLVTLHGLKPESSKLAYRVQAMNWILLVLVRLPPSIYAATFLPVHSVRDPIFWVNGVCLFIYTRFNVNVIINVGKRLEILQFVDSKPAYLKVVQKYNVSLYGIFFGIASFVGAILTSRLYFQSSPARFNPVEISRLNIQLLFTGLAAMFGARLPSALFNSSGASLYRGKFSVGGLWIQGGMFAAVLSVFISPLVDRYRLFLCLSMALPAGEAIGRVGCYFASCCGDPNTRKMPIQLLSAILNTAIAISSLLIYGFAYTTLEEAAVLALACNAAIRMILRPNLFAVAQLMTAMAMLGLKTPEKAPMTAPFTPNTFHRGWNDTGAEKFLFSSTGSPMVVEYDMLKNPWTAVLAVSSLIAGSFVQGCSLFGLCSRLE